MDNGQWTRTVEAWGAPWRVCRLMLADSHYFEEEQDPRSNKKSDPDSALNEKERSRSPFKNAEPATLTGLQYGQMERNGWCPPSCDWLKS